MKSLADWLADQVTEATRPIAHRLTADTLSRLRVNVTITFDMGDD